MVHNSSDRESIEFQPLQMYSILKRTMNVRARIGSPFLFNAPLLAETTDHSGSRPVCVRANFLCSTDSLVKVVAQCFCYCLPFVLRLASLP